MDPQRFLPPYAECFVEDLAAHSKSAYPGRHLVRRLPPLAPTGVRPVLAGT
jgi:hypothetical protein